MKLEQLGSKFALSESLSRNELGNVDLDFPSQP